MDETALKTAFLIAKICPRSVFVFCITNLILNLSDVVTKYMSLYRKVPKFSDRQVWANSVDS